MAEVQPMAPKKGYEVMSVNLLLSSSHSHRYQARGPMRSGLSSSSCFRCAGCTHQVQSTETTSAGRLASSILASTSGERKTGTYRIDGTVRVHLLAYVRNVTRIRKEASTIWSSLIMQILGCRMRRGTIPEISCHCDGCEVLFFVVVRSRRAIGLL